MRCDAKAFLDGENLAHAAVVLAHPFERCQAEILVDQAQIDPELERTPDMRVRVAIDSWLSFCGHSDNQSLQGGNRKPRVGVNRRVEQVRVKRVLLNRHATGLQTRSPKLGAWNCIPSSGRQSQR